MAGKSGWRHTAAARDKIRRASLGRTVSEETRRKLRAANIGKKPTDATKKRISLAMRARALSGYVNPMKGNRHSDEARRKMSANRMGIRPSAATRAKRSKSLSGANNPMWGKKLTEAHKLKISASITGQKRSESAKENISKSLLGSKHPNWQGGITPENKKVRGSRQYALWRDQVFTRDNYTCVLCGRRGGYLEADHIMAFAHYEDLRFEVYNGRTLCEPCHKETANHGGKARRYAI